MLTASSLTQRIAPSVHRFLRLHLDRSGLPRLWSFQPCTPHRTASSNLFDAPVSCLTSLVRGAATAAAGSAPSLSQRAELARSLAEKRRFYDTVRVSSVPNGYQVLLGTRPVKTPAKHPLVLPTYPLALAVAAEWEWLEKGKPILHAMPLMSLAATAIDQPKERAKVVDNLLKYVHTDAACVRHEPGPMQQRQAQVFDPLLQWAAAELGWRLEVSDSICGITQPPDTVEAARTYLEGLDAWRLAAVEQLTAASKSLVVAAAAACGRLTADQVQAAARLEEDAQMEEWGCVEAGHDLDMADMASRVGAPVVLLRLLQRQGGSAPSLDRAPQAQ